MREIVIDLSATDGEPGPAPSRRRRWLVALGVTLMTLLGATAAQPAPKPPFHRLMWIDAQRQDIMTLSPDLLVLHERGRSLVAYTLDGRLAWRRDFTGLQLSGASLRDGSLVVMAIDLPSSEGRTLFIDPATGAETWRADGEVSVMDGYLVVNSWGPTARLRVLNASDRTEIWRLPAGRLLQGFRDGRVYSLGPGGLFTEHDLATGESRRTLTLSPTGLDGIVVVPGEDYAQIVRQGGQELAERIDLTTFTLIRGTAELWTQQRDCGPVTCAYGFGTQAVLDNVTGKVLWQVPPGYYLVPTPAGLLARAEGGLSLVDFYTGREQPLLRWLQVAPGGEAEMTRFLARNRIGQPAADFAELRPSGLVPVGRLPITVNTCQHSGRVLACVSADEKIGVWRYNGVSAHQPIRG